MPKPDLSNTNEFPKLPNPLEMTPAQISSYKLPAQLTKQKLDQIKLYSSTNLQCAYYYAMLRLIQHVTNNEMGSHINASFETLNNFLNVYKMAPNSTEAKESIKLALQVASQFGSYQHFYILKALSEIKLVKSDENFKDLNNKLSFANKVLEKNPSKIKEVIPLFENHKPNMWSTAKHSAKNSTTDIETSQHRTQFGQKK